MTFKDELLECLVELDVTPATVAEGLATAIRGETVKKVYNGDGILQRTDVKTTPQDVINGALIYDALTGGSIGISPHNVRSVNGVSARTVVHKRLGTNSAIIANGDDAIDVEFVEAVAELARTEPEPESTTPELLLDSPTEAEQSLTDEPASVEDEFNFEMNLGAPEETKLLNSYVKVRAALLLNRYKEKVNGSTADLAFERESLEGKKVTIEELLVGLDSLPREEKVKHLALQELIKITGLSVDELVEAFQGNRKREGLDLTEGSVKTLRAPTKRAPESNKTEWQRCMEDFEVFTENVSKIRYRPGLNPDYPDGGSGYLKLTMHQKNFIGFLMELWLAGLPVRVILLKARQLGMTTALLAFWLWLACQIENFVVFFMIDKDAHMFEKRDMLLSWIENMEEKYADQGAPTLKAKGGKRIVLSNSSKFLLDSAYSPNPGTSEMVDVIHLSEKPKWPKGKAKAVDTSLLPGMPSSKNTFVVDESTAQGHGNFYKKWSRVMEGKETGRARTRPVFIPWHHSPEYTEEVPASCYNNNGEFIFLNEDEEVCELDELDGIATTEEEYFHKYGLTLEQLYWRRLRIKNTYKGIQADFNQEYPTTPDHAWSALRDSILWHRNCKQCRKYAQEPIIVGEIQDTKGNNDPQKLGP